MESFDFKFMALSDYLNSLSDYFGTFDYYQENDEIDEPEFILSQLDAKMLLS
tara:strand:+ start:17935 stop:18090 length:156 start_codon:yes stop_codon:yes gene_type:complete